MLGALYNKATNEVETITVHQIYAMRVVNWSSHNDLSKSEDLSLGIQLFWKAANKGHELPTQTMHYNFREIPQNHR